MMIIKYNTMILWPGALSSSHYDTTRSVCYFAKPVIGMLSVKEEGARQLTHERREGRG